MESSYNTLASKFFKYKYESVLRSRGYGPFYDSSPLPLSAYNFEPFVTHHPKGVKAVVDYIFNSEELRVMQILATPHSRKLSNFKPTPNSLHPSDHYPIVADFLLPPRGN